jgi:hypothetical protein
MTPLKASLAYCVFLLACSSSTDGPVPVISSVMPNPISDAQRSATVTITGTGFSPIVKDALTSNASVVMPVVRLIDAAVIEIPAANVTAPDQTGTKLGVTIAQGSVAPGTYDVEVINPDGHADTLTDGLVVVDDEFTLAGIDPPFGCTCSDTPVTITTAGGEFVSTPRVELRPAGQVAPVYQMKRTAYLDGNTITSVVPSGLPLGLYDVTVFDPLPSTRFGQLMNAFRVVQKPVPTIEGIVPDRAPPGTVVNATISGNNFRAAARVELLDRTGAVVATATTTTVTNATTIATTFTTPATQDAYLVRVTDLDEMTYSTFSAFIVGAEGASGNLHTFSASSTLNTARRMFGGVSARDDLGNTFIYAIGGDAGSGGTVLDTVEVAQLSKFGALGGWKQVKASNKLLSVRDAPAAIAVPLFGTDPFIPVKTYVYVTGGNTGAAVLGSIERAVVLRNADAPTILSIAPAAGAGSLAAGTWYYKVSAVLGAGDPDNPNGETLPSDEEILTLSASQTAIDLSWSAVPGAVGYRVYRTKMTNAVSQQEFLIASPTGTSYTDMGATATNEPPLPPGSLGVFQVDAQATGIRWGHQAAVITDNQGGAGGRSLYVLGGKNNATTGYLATIEHAPIDATGHLGAFVTTGTTVLPAPLAFFSLVVETPQNVAGFTGVARLITLGGVDAAGASNEIQQSSITSGGGNGAWALPFATANLQLTLGGNMAVIASEKLFVLGGATMATATTFTNIRSQGEDVAFGTGTNAGLLVAPVQSAASTLPAARALGVPISGSGFIYFVGGTSNGTDATNTCYQTF